MADDALMVWTRCGCGDFWCSIHELHAHDCDCPAIEDWETDPYSTPTPVLVMA
jgi:hypothetical protein